MMPPQGALSIERMCALAGVSRASYYRHWRRVAPRREQTELRDVLQRLAVAHRHYGYRRLNALLRREGWAVNHKRVLRLMRTDNLLCLRRRAFVPATTDSRHNWLVVPNLARGMQVTGLDQLWVADITYLRLREEFAFLAVVIDAFSRRVVGWAVDVHLRAALAVTALQMALEARSAVRLCRVQRPAGGSRDPAEHEPGRLAIRQRPGGELHEHAETRRGRRARLPDCPGGASLDRQLHRGDLQSAAAALGLELPGTRRL